MTTLTKLLAALSILTGTLVLVFGAIVLFEATDTDPGKLSSKCSEPFDRGC